ncbi:unnamed protein product [Orchesella dallaii]|uniref:Uncharacterized protein n=1 Tax=Orchesella dallaii TaxID=48710 RepID=A0ABP1RZK6_9HEXA
MISIKSICHGRIRQLFLLTFILLLLYITVINVYFSNWNSPLGRKEDWPAQVGNVMSKLNQWMSTLFEFEGNDPDARPEFLRYDVACRIPKLDPLHPSIKHLIKEPEKINCEDRRPLLFNSTFNSTLIPLKSRKEMEDIGIKSCCYKLITRPDFIDNSFKLSKQCFPIQFQSPTVVPPHHEFLAIYCDSEGENGKIVTHHMDTHAFVPLKPNVDQRLQEAQEKLQSPEEKINHNVVIIGIDAMSRMSFLRSLPSSMSFLLKELDAVEMHGYNVVGPNTYPNLAAALTSLNVTEINSTCVDSNHSYDSCSMIWKNFSSHGFHTSYGDDDISGGTFNFLRNGFKNPPTDYYLNSFTRVAGHLRRTLSDTCFGPRFASQVLLDYAQKTAYTMGKNNKRYFQFLWLGIAHDRLNDGRLFEPHLLFFLKWLKQGGYLEKTILLLMSDHGLRKNDILNFQQGQLEKKLPFIYFVLPKWFKEKYQRAYQNLRANQDRLMTAFDLHETLGDLITLERLTNEAIMTREESLKEPFPRGISLFLVIPPSRTCSMAGIDDHHCTCRNFVDVPVTNPKVTRGAEHAVHFMNEILSNYPQCMWLTVKEVKSAKAVKDFMRGDLEQYQILLETEPSGGSFLVTVTREGNEKSWNVSGIERTNLYGNQSHCVDTKEAKQYCYCNDLKENILNKI